MNYDDTPSQPTPDPSQEFISARARRRRAQRRAYFPTDEAGRTALYEHLAQRAFPSYELFVFALISGVILGIGFFFNTQALLFFGILVAPLLTTWVGLSLSVIAGSGRLFFQTLVALLISSLLIFSAGLLAGYVSRILPNESRTFTAAFENSRLWWPNLAIITIAAIILTVSFVRSENRPYLPSALFAYGILLPIGAAGFGLGSGVPGIWPQGALVFVVHFAWATFFGILTLFFLRFYPISVSGAAITGLVIVIVVVTVIFLTGFDQWIRIRAGLATPEPAPVTQAIAPPTALPTETPAPVISQTSAFVGIPTRTPSATITPTLKATVKPSLTSTFTVTAEPTPIIGLIKASEGGGALIRKQPGGAVITILANGTVVTIVPNDIQEINGVIWVHIIALVNNERVDGWLIQSVLVTATPVAEWQPSSTPEFTATP